MTPDDDLSPGADRSAWEAFDALRDVAAARRAAARAARPSSWPRVAQAVTLGGVVALTAVPTSWSPYLVLALPVAALVLRRAVSERRAQVNGLQAPRGIGLRILVFVVLLGVTVLALFGATLFGWPWWVPLVGGALEAVVLFAIGRAFDLRMWREWVRG